VATKLGTPAETLRKRVRQAERDTGQRPGLTTSERERLATLKRENRELKRTNEILTTASGVFRPGGARPPEQVVAMVSYIDAHRERFGVESICRVLPIATST